MELSASRPLPVSQAVAWAALNNPEILQACIPGCEQFEATEPNVYAARVALKIGPVAAKFTGKVSLGDIQPPERYALTFEASAGVAGFGKGQAQVRLEPQGAQCVLHYTVQAQVGGKIAQIGQRLIDGVAKSLSEEFFRKFEEQLVARQAAETTAPVEETTAQEASGSVLSHLQGPWGLLAPGVLGTGLIAFGLLLQAIEGVVPCPMCIMQRLLWIALVAVSLLGAFAQGRSPARLTLLAQAAIALAGAFVAARQSWLQWYPPEVVSCGRDFYGIVDTFPLRDALPMLLKGSGDCSAVDWTFLGGSIANWSFLMFAATVLYVAWLWRVRRAAA